MLQAILPPTQKRPKTARTMQRKQYGDFEVIWGMENDRFWGGTIRGEYFLFLAEVETE